MKKSQLKQIIKEVVHEVKMESILDIGKKSLEAAEKILEKQGIPRLSLEEKKTHRKRLYEQIIRESKNKPAIDPKKLLEEVKEISKSL